MARHERRIIREAVAALLRGRTAAETRVFETRMVPHRALGLPAVSVYTTTEPIDQGWRTSPRELKRNLQLVVDAVVKLDKDTDDQLDALALEIEELMDVDPTLGGVCSDSILANTETGVDVRSDQELGVVIMTYSITYHTPVREARSQALDDFETANVKTNGAEDSVDLTT